MWNVSPTTLACLRTAAAAGVGSLAAELYALVAELGPEGALDYDVYLRTAISVETDGWANFGYVKMPDYAGALLAHTRSGRWTIAFGDHRASRPARGARGVRSALRRLIVTRHTERPPSSSNASRTHLPSIYDLRNLFQINVRRRHLWAMVYLLQAYFGRERACEAMPCSNAIR